ncbi:MAG TPA: hypothetical protein VHK90_07145 [Thermoanaerobaculia bacterium]|nr:hypothetical protein [Thermoanaerobaculia bacterium]
MTLEPSRICITLDVDWAPDAVMQPVLDAMRDAGVKATFFATHDSALLQSIGTGSDFEVGLHPNFNNCGGDFETPLRTLKEIYPSARGARSHSPHVSSHILQLYRKYGLQYESNNFMPMHQHLHPMMRFERFVSIPFYWSDDRLEVYDWFDLETLALDSPGLKVLNFHPMHVFMNTSSEAHYLSYKQHYQDADALRPFIHRGTGVRSLFDAVLQTVRERGLPTYTMGEICDEFLRSHS